MFILIMVQCAETRGIQSAIKRDQCEYFPPIRQVTPPHSEWHNASRRQHSKGLGDQGYVMAFELISVIRGFHVYKQCWDPKIGEKVQCVIEENNKYDNMLLL